MDRQHTHVHVNRQISEIIHVHDFAKANQPKHIWEIDVTSAPDSVESNDGVPAGALQPVLVIPESPQSITLNICGPAENKARC